MIKNYTKLKEIQRTGLFRGKMLNQIQKFKGKYENIKEGPALGYFVGVIDGDGSAYITYIRNCKRYRISLGVKDKDFSKKFQECIYKITGNIPNIRYCEQNTNFGINKLFFVTFVSKKLYELAYNKRLYYAKKYSKEYLKGIFDSEGCVRLNHKKYPYISLSSFDIRIIKLSRKLLKIIGIVSTNRKSKSGEYNLYIRRRYNQKFIKHIDFSIERKHERLIGNKEYFPSERYKNG